jgi:hypothetical protein
VSQWHHDFEPVGGGTVGVAQFFSAYDDKTDGSWHVPGDASWYSSIVALRGAVMGPTMAAAAPQSVRFFQERLGHGLSCLVRQFQ